MRRASSRSSACSKSSSRSSSTSKSALRVMRNAWCSTISKPGNSTGRKAAISSSIGRNRTTSEEPSRGESSTKRFDVVGHLDSGEVLAAVVGLFDGDCEVQAQPAHEWERVGGIDRKRRQHREHLLVEVVRQSRAFVIVEFATTSRSRCPRRLSAGRTESRNTCACLLAICWVRSLIRRSCSRGVSPSAERTDRPISSRRFSPATRTM